MAKQLKSSDEALIKAALEAKRATAVWKPTEKGESLVGTVTRMKALQGDNDNTYISITLEDDEGVRWVVNAGALLMDEIEEQSLKKGDRAAFVFHGTEKAKKGRMNVVTMAVSKRGS